MPVNVVINARDMDMSDRLHDYVTKKVSKLDRYLDILEEATVDLRYIKTARNANDRNVAQLTIRGKGVLLRAEERTDDIFASFDSVMDKIHRRIDRYKGKHWNKRGDGRSVAEVILQAEPREDEPIADPSSVVRRKRFSLAPMDEAEAIEQMGLLGHEDFFVFLNADTNQVNILYRRRDGSLGLIEPDFS
jgi:putative sigma-54 modulation protein